MRQAGLSTKDMLDIFSSAKRCPSEDMHTEIYIHNPTIPLLAFEHLSPSMVICNSPSRPKHINVDKGRPRQTKADPGRPQQTKASKWMKVDESG